MKRQVEKPDIRQRVEDYAKRPKVAIPVIGALLTVIAVGLGIWLGLAVATFVVVLYGTVLTAILVVGWRPFEALPEIRVGLRHGGETLTHVDRRPARHRRAIDSAACVDQETEAARVTVPPRPAPLSPRDRIMPGPLSDLRESYDEALQRFSDELRTFAADLRAWLDEYEERRWPSYSHIALPVIIENRGASVADGITLNIRIPGGWTALHSAKDLRLPSPPVGPRYERRSTLDHITMPTGLRPTFPKIPESPEGLVGPEYNREGDHLVARFRMDSLTHGDNAVSKEPLVIFPDVPGTHTITWTAHVGNLKAPGNWIDHHRRRPA